MVDVALSIFALIAGGVSLELFAAAQPTVDKALAEAQAAGEDFVSGNPS